MGLPVQQGQRQIAPHQQLLDLLATGGIGTGQDKTHFGPRFTDLLRGIKKQPAQLAHFAAATAGHQGHQRPVWQPKFGASSGLVGFKRDGIGQGMPDETHGNAVLFIEFGFKGQQREHQIAAFADFQHALLPPRPHGRAYVMHGLDPGTTQLKFDIEGEIRRIDTDKHIGFFGNQGLHQQLAALEQFTQAPQHFNQAHDRQAFHREVGTHALCFHQRTANADKFDVAMLRLERPHQPRAQNVARGFTRHQRNTQSGHD